MLQPQLQPGAGVPQLECWSTSAQVLEYLSSSVVCSAGSQAESKELLQLLQPGDPAFEPGSFDGLHHMPGPDRSFLQEYRLNSKPHIRRILQHQQSEADAQQPQPVQAAAESSQASIPEQQAQATRAEPSTLRTIEHELAPSWRPASPCHQACRPRERAQAVAEPHQASGLQDAGSWRPVTASQMLKRQRGAAPSQQRRRQQQQQQQQQQMLQVSDNTSDIAEKEGPHMQTQQQHILGVGDCTGPPCVHHNSILNQSFHDEATDSGAAWQDWEPLGCPAEQLEGWEGSCSDVGQAFADEDCEADQELAWAEPPPGFGEGLGEDAHDTLGSKQAVAMHAPRTWSCQVCTFAGNRAQVLRCALCDAVRGTSWRRYQSAAAEQSVLPTPSMPTESAPGGEQRGSGRASASNGMAKF